MANLDKSIIDQFIIDLFSGTFNHLSDYVRDELDGGGMSDYINKNNLYDIDNNDIFYYVMTSCFSLKRYDIVSYFIEKNKNKFTSDLFISSNDFSEALDFLVDKNIIIDYNKVLIHCCISDCIGLLKHIVEKYYTPQPLIIYIKNAIEQKSYDIIEYFVNVLKFDINQLNKRGESYLHLAAMRYKPEKLIGILYRLGIDDTIRDNNGETAFDVLYKRGVAYRDGNLDL